MNVTSLLSNPSSDLRKIAIGISLFFLWVGLTLWYIVIFDQSALVLSYNHGEANFTSITHERLLEGEKLKGEFVGEDDNLGIVSVRFEKLPRIPYHQEDRLVFRIKEKGAEEWYYENVYMSGLTFDVPFLPFGFPPISDSKGKTYQFETESLEGNHVNGVILSDRNPILVSKYQKNKEVLLSNPPKLAEFLYKKIMNSLSTVDVAYSSFIFSLPLIFYLIWISPLKKYLIIPLSTFMFVKSKLLGKKILGKKFKYFASTISSVILHWMITILVVSILIDILLLQIHNDLIYVSAVGLWLFLMYFYKKDCRASIVTGLGLLLIAPTAYELQNINTAEKASAWAFMFFSAGVVQAIFSLRKSKK